MPDVQMVVFDDQDQIDGYNASFNPGISIIAENNGGQLVYPKYTIDRILATDHGLSPTQVATLEILPIIQVFIPSDDEKINTLESTVSELYVLDSMPFDFSGPASDGQSPENYDENHRAVSPALVGCVGITFSNDIDGSGQDIEFYVDGILQYTWSITNARYGHISALRELPFFVMNVGSTIYTKVNNVGTTPGQNIRIRCYFGLASAAPVQEQFYANY